MRSRTVFLVAILLWVFSGPALADKRVALVIGNSAYQNVPKLPNPQNDAAAIADLLRKAQFDVVESKRDLTNTEMRRVLRDFSDKSRDADMAVVFYAGHGIEVDGTNYLVPVDAILDRDSDAFDETVQLDRVLQAIEPARKLRLVILDACRDNPFARTMKRTLASRALGRGLAGVEPGKPNTLIAFAAKGGSTAADGAGANSPFTLALLKHLTTPGLDLRQVLGRVRDEVIKATDNRQEPFVYGSLGGATVALVPAAVQTAAPTQPAADPQAGVRRDYELALQLNSRAAWEVFLQSYPSGFYAGLARVQIDKIAADEARTAAIEKAKQADAEKARLAAEGAKAAEQAKAAREAKAAEEARIAAEKQRQTEQAKADASERARAAAERAAAEKLAKEKSEAEAKAAREQAQAEAKAAKDKAEAEAKAAEAARKAADKEQAEKIKLAALEQKKAAEEAAKRAAAEQADESKPAAEKGADSNTQVAALPADAAKTTLSQTEINRLLQAELRRVGCQTAAAGGEWGTPARRSLELFNKHANTRLDTKLASLDALDAVKAKQARVCPLVCEHGSKASGDKCEKIVCRPGFAVGDGNTCEKVEQKKPVAKKDAPAADAPKRAEPPKAQASGSGPLFCDMSGCRTLAKGCREERTQGNRIVCN